MDHFDGTAVRQLDLVDEANAPIIRRDLRGRPKPSLRLLQKDIYAELARRRRQAQIRARHLIQED
jgi:hypothetical protein